MAYFVKTNIWLIFPSKREKSVKRMSEPFTLTFSLHEINNSPLFLVIFVTKTKERKQTHTDWYVYAQSNYHPAQIQNVANTSI